MMTKFAAVITILVHSFLCLLCAFVGPTAADVVALVGNRAVLAIPCGLPALIAIGYILWFALVSAVTKKWSEFRSQWMVWVVLVHGLSVILATGGIVRSPIVPFWIVVPIVISKFFEPKIRDRLMWTFLLLVLTAAALAWFEVLHLGKSYPIVPTLPWEFAWQHRLELVLVTLGIVTGALAELLPKPPVAQT